MKQIIIPILASLILSGCSHTPTDADIQRQLEEQRVKEEQQSAAVEESVDVTVQNFAFSPSTITVKPGTVLRVTNRDVAGHTMTSDDGTSFNTPIIGKDQTVEVTAPTEPGSYDFHCVPHPNMKGTLVVEG